VLWGAWGQFEGAPVLATGVAGSVRLWHVEDTEAEMQLRPQPGHDDTRAGHFGRVSWGAWDQVEGTQVLATGGIDGEVWLWLLDPGTTRTVSMSSSSAPTPKLWGAWGRVDDKLVLATGGDDDTVLFLSSNLEGSDPSEVTFADKAATHGFPVLPLSSPPQLFSLESMAEGTPGGHSGPTLWGAWGQVEGAPVLATGGADGTVRLWDPATHTDTVLTGHHFGRVFWGAWGQVEGAPVLATGAEDGKVLLWDPAARTVRLSLTGHTGRVLWGAWGQVKGAPVLATGGEDRTVRLWHTDAEILLANRAGRADHRPPVDLVGHTGRVLWGAWGQVEGAQVLATGGEDGTVRLWDPDPGSQLGVALAGHTGPVLWGTWGLVKGTPVLATGGEDGTVRLWDLVLERVVPRVPRYISDTAGATDRLGRQEDAAALADVITARSARPPLAVGVFGQWGEGKSLFLEMLEEQVNERARVAGPDDKIAHGFVRQVRFNAWHYAEADLWASLVAELFAQLSAGADPTREQRQRSRLASELIEARGVREQLAAAQARLADLQRASAFSTSQWEALPTPAKQRLQELFGDQAQATYQEVASTASTTKTTLRSIAALVQALPRGWLVGSAAALILAAILAAAALKWGSDIVRWVAALPVVVGLGALVGAIRKAWDSTRPLRQKLRSARQVVQQARAEQIRRLETAEAVAAAEVQELQSRLQNLTAAGQLAGLVQERAGAATYRQRLGLMTQIRQDFERMAELLERDGPGQSTVPKEDEAGDELPAIDRIVVYIDDLDRCPPDRVVEVLEAVHLLLAVRLFVVVVAVDPRWLLRSLTSHYQELFAATAPQHADAGASAELTVDLGEEELWASTPAQYLEKIFQIVLTLAPMKHDGYQRMMDDLVGVQDTPVTEPNQHSADQAAPPAPHAAPSVAGSASTLSSPPPPDQERISLDSLRIVHRIDPLALTGDEHKLIGLLGPPLIAAPRAVKRLANSYGLLVAISAHLGVGSSDRPELRPVPDVDHGQAYPYRASMVLLAAVIGFPMLGPTFFPDIHRTARETPEATWNAYLHDLRPERSDQGWANRIEPTMTTTRKHHWNAFLDAIEGIGNRASKAGLPLPQRLDIWARWVVPVGRLSFPTGSAVSRLTEPTDQQPGTEGLSVANI